MIHASLFIFPLVIGQLHSLPGFELPIYSGRLPTENPVRAIGNENYCQQGLRFNVTINDVNEVQSAGKEFRKFGAPNADR